MENKVRGKVLKAILDNGQEVNYKDIVLDFEEYMNDALVMAELRDMSAKDIVRIVREVWEECKSIN